MKIDYDELGESSRIFSGLNRLTHTAKIQANDYKRKLITTPLVKISSPFFVLQLLCTIL